MRKRHKALTLVELMAALAIVALLTAAAMTALTRAAASSSRETSIVERSWLPSHLRDALECDLMHATQCQVTDDGFALKTLASLRADSLKLEHLPVTVEYRIEALGGQSCLIRTQHDEDGLAEGFAELVAAGVTGISMETLAAETIESEEWREMSGSLFVSVYFEDEDIPTAEYIYTFSRD